WGEWGGVGEKISSFFFLLSSFFFLPPEWAQALRPYLLNSSCKTLQTIKIKVVLHESLNSREFSN
ncbi:hypothetical protein, partial [Aphanizomenon flos-aquae]|uniref:hypothetical protein n=1 Tax=Aphanizomenon flos-aquae TaxID=1176 RepID=UPI001F1CC175